MMAFVDDDEIIELTPERVEPFLIAIECLNADEKMVKVAIL